MIYNVGDKFILAGVECYVALVNSQGNAYLAPEFDGDEYQGSKTLRGLVFAILDPAGHDALGNRALPAIKTECGAV